MQRRHFLQALGSLGTAALLPMTLVRPAYGATPTRFLITVSASGGWDPTSLIDPKGNALRSDGLGPINNYSATQIKTIGNLRYAAYPDGITPPDVSSAGHLDTFFAKHYTRLRVINGIDTQTNGHESGQRFVWSGKLETGYPSVAALAAAPYAEYPMAFISNGGYDYTASLVAPVRTASASTFSALAYPNSQFPTVPTLISSGFHSAPTYAAVELAREQRLSRLRAQETLPSRVQQLSQLEKVRSGDVSLDRLLAELPATVSAGVKGQAEVAIAAFASGLAVSATLNVGGFDTHANHDEDQVEALTNLLEGVDHLWAQIVARGMQDKVTILIGSDFGRTPFYNAAVGKDHWNITSVMAMGAGITGNTLIGETDARFEALKINPATLQVHSSGITLTPKHLHRSLRDFLGVPKTLDQQFPLAVEAMPLLG